MSLRRSDRHLKGGLIISHFQHRGQAIARDVIASAAAVATYILAALCAGWLVSLLLDPIGHVWLRYAAEAAISTCGGMIVSWRLTNALFPRRSGKVIFSTFAGVVLLVSLMGRSSSVNWLHTAQALLLVGLAYGLFWPRQGRSS